MNWKKAKNQRRKEDKCHIHGRQNCIIQRKVRKKQRRGQQQCNVRGKQNVVDDRLYMRDYEIWIWRTNTIHPLLQNLSLLYFGPFSSGKIAMMFGEDILSDSRYKGVLVVRAKGKSVLAKIVRDKGEVRTFDYRKRIDKKRCRKYLKLGRNPSMS